MQLQYATQDEVPEDLKGSYVEFKDGEETVFMHNDLAEAKKEAFRFKGDLTQVQKTAQEKAERLSKLEEAQKLRDEQAEADELANKQKNGQHEEILNDFKTKAEQRELELKGKLEELSNSVRAKEKANVVGEFASLGTPETKEILRRVVEQDLEFGDDGSLVVIENGKASSTTLEQYKEKLKDLYPALVSESHGSGGKGKGGIGSVTPSKDVNNKAAEDAKKKGDLGGFLNAKLNQKR